MNILPEIHNIADIVRMLRSELSPIYGEGEAKGMISLIFQNLKGWDNTRIIINYDQPASDYLKEKIQMILEELKNGKPIQYILGKANFYGMYLDVDKSTLIPRPETEQLVDLIVHRYSEKEDLRVLDIGTGSGAIALALARNLPFSVVSAIDISSDAIAIAKRNAENLKCKVQFIQADIFEYDISPDSFDIIVSNPPYICESEKSGMAKNVLDYEPGSALFVPDNDPLKYYHRIAEISQKGLAPKGSLYFEINPLYSKELKETLLEMGYKDIEIENDFYNHQRFISARI